VVGIFAWECTGVWALVPTKTFTVMGPEQKIPDGTKQKIQAGTHAEPISGPHDVGRPLAATMW